MSMEKYAEKEIKTLTKKELLKLLEPYDDNKLICFSVKLQQGTVGFTDITQSKNTSNKDYIVLNSEKLNEWYLEDIKELKNEKRSLSHCLRYRGESKCYYTEELCDENYVQICEDYKSDEGTYLCPHCNRKGLKLLDYGSDKVWECLRCGAELWYCESKEKMLERCNEIKERKMIENKRFELTYERGKPNFWDNDVDLADCYLTCEDVVDLLNEQNEKLQTAEHLCRRLQRLCKGMVY